jgi:hypothetical protein
MPRLFARFLTFPSSSLCAISATVATIAALTHDRAFAQGKLEASYSISVARITIGNASVTAEIGETDYTASMSARGSGVLRILSSGDGNLKVQGHIRDGLPVPARYVSSTTADDDKLDVEMSFENGNATALEASPPPPSADRVALTEQHRNGVMDPLTALFIPVGDAGLTQAACARVLPIFDGRRRYDLKLDFKRFDRVKVGEGYEGPVVVCAMALLPIAGHRKSSPMLNFLTGGREMEIAFAPVAGTALIAPLRVTVFYMLGNLVMQATKFMTSSSTVGTTPP